MKLRIATYNVRKAVGLDWRRDPMRIARVLSGIGADIVLLQEADKRLGARPAALDAAAVAATGLHALDVSEDGPSLGWHGNAVLARSGIALGRIDRVVLPALEPRGALAMLLEADGVPLRVAALHFGLLRASRRRQKSAVLAALDGLGDAPMMMGGDFNERTLWRLTDMERAGLRSITPGPSFHAARPVLALDHFVVGPGVTVLRSGVVTDGEARRASDHLPVWMDVEIGVPVDQSVGVKSEGATASYLAVFRSEQ